MIRSCPKPWIVVLLVVIATAGCQFVPNNMKSPAELFGFKKEPAVPGRMMIIWTDTILHQPQQPGVRGFGGRIYFYTDQGTEPIAVDGGLAVYAFDADQLDPELTRPKRKFVFTAEQFSEYMSHTTMGPSYSVWLPWDEVGGFGEQLSLIVRFEGTQGGVVISDPTIKLLPGREKPKIGRNNADSPLPSMGVAQAGSVSNGSQGKTQLAGFEEAQPINKKPRRETQTIDLPPSFYRHLEAQSQATNPAFAEPQNSLESPSAEQAFSQPIEQAAVQTNQPPVESSADRAAAPNSRWARYPFRTQGADYVAPPNGQRHQQQPAGWMQSLPKTPRGNFSNRSD